MTGPITNPSEALRQALAHHQAGRLEAAGALYRQILDVAPDNADALHLLGVIALQSGRNEGAADLIRRAIRAHPDRGTYHCNLGIALQAMGEPEDAADSYRRALELDPDDVETLNNLGNALQEMGRLDDAVESYRRAIARDPRYVKAFNNLGAALQRQGLHDAAIAAYRDATGIDPRYAEAFANLGGALVEAGRADEALAAFRRALDVGPATPRTLNGLGQALYAQGALEESADALGRALAIDPDDAEALNNLASVRRDQDRLDEALPLYARALRLNRAPGANRIQPPDTFRRTARTKLEHDIEQFRYLMAQGVLGSDYESVVADYAAVLDALSATPADGHMITLPGEARRRLAPTYNRLVHLAEAPALAGGALDPALDGAAIEADYRANGPGITYLDGLLRPEALAALRRFCLESTIWYEFRYANGYLGAFMQDGFLCPLLAQIAGDLRRLLPDVLGPHRLLQMWAFKYDSRLSGIRAHADFAAVNVNFWITPDDANLDPDSGGLRLWDKEAPADWDFGKYNSDDAAIEAFIAETGASMITVPHRQNRAVLFNSDLFHETDAIRFRDGYENRRINITMLFGRRGEA